MFKLWSNPTQRRDVHRFIGVYATIATFIAFALVSWKQSCQTREALQYADTANINTKRSIDIAEKNARIENRAWIALEMNQPPRTRIEGSENGNLISNVSWTITNFGKTPAENMLMGHYTCIGDLPAYKNRNIVFEQPYTMSPNEEKSYDCFHIIKSDSIRERIESKRTKFCFYGIIIYNDIYGITDTTDFGFIYAGDNAPMKSIGTNRIK